MKHLTTLLALSLTLAPLAAAEGSGLATITAPELQGHVDYLADDALEGRGTGSKGEHLAAEYLIKHFQTLGLEPASADGTFLHAFPVAGTTHVQGTPRLELSVGPWTRSLAFEDDMTPFGFGQGTLRGVELVFAGYGISAPEQGYDDYAGLDVKGKAVVVLRRQPDGMFQDQRHAYFTTKAEVAKRHGAVAVLVVNGPALMPGDESLTPSGAVSGAADLPMFHVRQALLNDLFELAGLDLQQTETQIAQTKKPVQRALKATLSCSLRLEREQKIGRNVVARLPGTDPALANEVLVIGAHYDHVGFGHSGGSLGGRQGMGQIHNGADDNASGTAALLELAQALSTAPLRRPVVFVAFSGEELGLLGSKAFVENPPFARERIVGMLNLDMVGRLRDQKLEVGGVGTSPGFQELVQRNLEAEGLSGAYTKSGQGPSDHASFYAAKIPVLFFFTGLHDDYHRPSDDADKLNAKGAESVTRVAFRCATEIGNADERPAFTEVKASRRRALLGIRLDPQAEGVRIQSVSQGSAADKAGLEAGDTILELQEARMDTTQDLMRRMTEFAPGDTVTVLVQRGDERLKLSVTLGGGR
ncbi:MAG: M20/M25/M40 family metallo-hydrolase [Planctomycetota bacterium]